MKHASGESIAFALVGVIGEAIDIATESLLFVGVPIVFEAETKVDKEESDSEFDEIEPC